MTVNEAKKDVATRLEQVGIKFDKLKAKTWDFGGLGYGSMISITVMGAKTPFGPHRKTPFATVPKPSQGGYSVSFDDELFS